MKYIYILPIYFILKRVIVYLAVKRNKILGPLFDKLYELSTLVTNSLGYRTNLKVLNTLGHNTRLPFKEILGELEYRLGSNEFEKVIRILIAVDLPENWNKASKLFYFSFYYKLFILANLFHILNIYFVNTLKLLGLGFLISIFNFKFNIFSNYPLINMACNYLLIQFKKWLGLDYREYIKWLPSTQDEIDSVVKEATKEQENILIDATKRYNERIDKINEILKEKIPSPEGGSWDEMDANKKRKYIDSFIDYSLVPEGVGDKESSSDHPYGKGREEGTSNNNKLYYLALATFLSINCILWGLDNYTDKIHDVLRTSEWMSWYLDHINKVPAFFTGIWRKGGPGDGSAGGGGDTGGAGGDNAGSSSTASGSGSGSGDNSNSSSSDLYREKGKGVDRSRTPSPEFFVETPKDGDNPWTGEEGHGGSASSSEPKTLLLTRKVKGVSAQEIGTILTTGAGILVADAASNLASGEEEGGGNLTPPSKGKGVEFKDSVEVKKFKGRTNTELKEDLTLPLNSDKSTVKNVPKIPKISVPCSDIPQGETDRSNTPPTATVAPGDISTPLNQDNRPKIEIETGFGTYLVNDPSPVSSTDPANIPLPDSDSSDEEVDTWTPDIVGKYQRWLNFKDHNLILEFNKHGSIFAHGKTTLKYLIGNHFNSEDMDTRLKTLFNSKKGAERILSIKTEIVEINEILQKQIIFCHEMYLESDVNDTTKRDVIRTVANSTGIAIKEVSRIRREIETFLNIHAPLSPTAPNSEEID